ncbi:phage portal protein [Mesorhizobium sp. CAU 1732]|uniref:phage portal protein n=1 Tax=Mesorhizobium sp. CAU 1732 TaxID=3140358 RepID=UPI003260FC87
MNFLDRVISAISPEAGVRRIGARQMLDAHSRAYAAAKHGRRNKGWSGRATSANAEVGSSLRELRNRSREFVRDSWAGQRMLDVLVSHSVGTGIVTVSDTGNDRVDNSVKLVFEEWSEQADIEGVLDWPGMQALSVRSMIEGGDTVVRHIDIPLNDAGRTVPVRLLGLESDQIDTTRDGMSGSGSRLGVELGEWGRRKGLWLLDNHPGEFTAASTASALVGWNDLAHLYRPLRFGQVRGVPWFSSILLTARELQDIVEATLVKMRVEASFGGFIKRTSAGHSPLVAKTDDKSDKPITRIEPGMIVDIGDGEISFANPSSQTAFGEVYMASNMAMAAGAGITYDQLTGDLRNANYSSLRAGKIEFRRLVEQTQWTILVPRLIAPTKRRVLDRAILAGRLKSRDRQGGYRLKHIMPAVEPIDPKKDLEADILACRSGRLAPQEFIGAWGRDWRDVVNDTASFMEFLDKQRDGAGLALDIDARNPMKGSANVGQNKPDAED